MAEPIVTLISDFGLEDWYVAAMKAAVLRHCPNARLIDVTHSIPAGDILRGSIVLERTVASFPAGTVHLAVVDPGVGTKRRLIAAEIAGQQVVCPDNGLITWAWRRQAGAAVHEITWRSKGISATFHGRDVMGPVAGMLAGGEQIGLARIADPVLLDVKPLTGRPRCARIIHIDHFGNATTNLVLKRSDASRVARVVVGTQPVGRVHRTYGDVASGRALALIGSSELLEIAVRDGSAAAQLDMRVGDEVQLVWKR